METYPRPFGIGSRLSRKKALPVGAAACLAILLAQVPQAAYAQDTVALLPAPARAPSPRVTPSHLYIGNQYFDASVSGMRQYLDGLKPTNPDLYAGLDPDLRRLEARHDAAVTVMTVGAIASVLSFVLAFATRNDCQAPSVNDPNFAAKSDAWGACNSDNLTTMAIFGVAGVGALAAGGAAAYATMPSRSDLLAFVNKHNRLNAQPLQLQIGYNPTSQFAYGGATLRF